MPATVGPERTDASPRGDDGLVVAERVLWVPDGRGNDRIDPLRNRVRDGWASALPMVPGSADVVRVNGRARLTADAEATARFARNDARPRCVGVIEVAEVRLLVRPRDPAGAAVVRGARAGPARRRRGGRGTGGAPPARRAARTLW